MRPAPAGRRRPQRALKTKDTTQVRGACAARKNHALQFNYIGNAAQACASGLHVLVIDPSDGQGFDQRQRSNAAG